MTGVPKASATGVQGETVYLNTGLAPTDCFTQKDPLGHGTEDSVLFCFVLFLRTTPDYWKWEVHEQKDTLSGEKLNLHSFVLFKPITPAFGGNCLLGRHLHQVCSWP